MTPGPWRTYPTHGEISLTVETVSGLPIAKVSQADKDTLDAIGNARLIAAAPELLEGLERLLESPILIGSHPESLAAYRQAQAAIAKARGA